MADYAFFVERLRYPHGRTEKGEDGRLYVCDPPWITKEKERVKLEDLQLANDSPAAVAYHREFNAHQGTDDQFNGDQFSEDQLYNSDSDSDDDYDNDFFYPADCEYIPGPSAPPKEQVEQRGVFKQGIDYDIDSDSDISSEDTEDSDCDVFSDDEEIEVKKAPTVSTQQIIPSPTDSSAAIAIVVTPPSPSVKQFGRDAATPETSAARKIPFGVVAMSDNPAIKMMDSDLLDDLARSNLRAPEITSIVIFGTNGTVVAHASSTYHLRDLRRLASTCGQTYLAHQESTSTTSNPISAAQIESTPTTSQGQGDVANIFLEFDTNTALVSRITATSLLAIVGPRELTEGASLPNGNHANTSSTKSESDSEEAAPNDIADDDDDDDDDDTASASTSSQRPTHQRRSSQDLAPNSSPLVLEALECKSEALTKYLKGIMGDVKLLADS
jgi:hypothetical protein